MAPCSFSPAFILLHLRIHLLGEVVYLGMDWYRFDCWRGGNEPQKVGNENVVLLVRLRVHQEAGGRNLTLEQQKC